MEDEDQKLLSDNDEIEVVYTEDEDKDDQIVDIEEIKEVEIQEAVNNKRLTNFNKIQCVSTN